MARPLPALLCAAALLAGCGGDDSEERRLPQGFVGVVADGPVAEPLFGERRLARELRSMVESGVESARITVSWAQAQPVRRREELPRPLRGRFPDLGGVPTNFGPTDRLVAAAAGRGISVLPTVLHAPAWAAKRPGQSGSPPREAGDYARFMGALVGRYGPSGSLWRDRPELPRVPIRAWQIWNEPYLERYWTDRPFAPSYTRLVRRAREAIRRGDPGAQVVLGGLASFGGTSWDYLEQIYRAGARPHFDAVAAHPFTERPGGVITILERMRAVMRRHGDASKPLLVTEFGWPSGKGDPKKVTYSWEETERRQAAKVARALELLARERGRLRIERVFHYSWLSPDRGLDSFAWAGLRRLRRSLEVEPKPALKAFRRAALELEGCARKGDSASSCAERDGR